MKRTLGYLSIVLFVFTFGCVALWAQATDQMQLHDLSDRPPSRFQSLSGSSDTSILEFKIEFGGVELEAVSTS